MAPFGKFVLVGLVGLVVLVTTALVLPNVDGSTTSAPRTSASVVSLSAPGRFAGVNENWLGWDENTGTYPTHAAILDGLEQAKAAGFTVIRSQTLGVSTGQPDSLEPSYDVWNAAAFDSIDYTLATASSLGLKVIIPLTDEWRYAQGGHWNFVNWAYQNGVPGVVDTLADTSQTTANNSVEKAAEQQFYSNATIIGYFESYISHLLTHVNAYNGVEIADDPTVLAYESGNELFDSAASQGCAGCADWTNTIAEYVKSLAPQALFIDGSAASGLGVANANGLTSQYVDWIDAHYYGSYESVAQLQSDAAAAAANGKSLYVGEYDWTGDTIDLPTWLSAIEADSNIVGDSPWDELPVIDGVAECHSDGFSFTNPASSGCPDTQPLDVQAAALASWATHSTVMAGSNVTVGTTPVTVGTTPVTVGTTPVTVGTTPVTVGTTPVTVASSPLQETTIASLPAAAADGSAQKAAPSKRRGPTTGPADGPLLAVSHLRLVPARS